MAELILLINSVKNHEAIYNSQCPEYRDSDARHAAWTSVAELCGSTIEECKESWKNLRNCFTNAKKRRRRSRNFQKFGPWKFDKEMSFLEPHLKKRPPPQDKEVEFVEDSWESSCSKTPTSNNITASLERGQLLIDLVRRYEVIYNKEYRDGKERNAAWAEIADLHGSTVAQCKEAWISLRNCYTNAIKRKYKQSAKNQPSKLWRFEKAMSFLRPHLNLHINVAGNSEEILYEDEDSWEASLSPKGITETPESGVTTRSATKRKSSPRDFFDFVDVDEDTPELVYDQDLDDIDHFFLSMSKMTKKLPKIDQLRIKLDLHKAINEAELNQLALEGRTKDGDSRKSGVKQEVSSPEHAKEHPLQDHSYLSYE